MDHVCRFLSVLGATDALHLLDTVTSLHLLYCHYQWKFSVQVGLSCQEDLAEGWDTVSPFQGYGVVEVTDATEVASCVPFEKGGLSDSALTGSPELLRAW